MRIGRNWRRSLAHKRVPLWVTLGIGLALIFFLLSIHKFLAVSNPVGEGVLVVEAWVPAKTLEESPIVFNSGRYRYLVIVGGPVQGSGSESNDRSEEHTSELQSHLNLVCRLLLEKKKNDIVYMAYVTESMNMQLRVDGFAEESVL